MDEGISLIISGTVAGSIITAVTQLISAKFKAKRDVGPQPFKVEFEKEFVRKDVWDKHLETNEKEHRNMFARLDQKSEEVAGLKTDVKHLSKQMDRVENKIDRLIGEKHNG